MVQPIEPLRRIRAHGRLHPTRVEHPMGDGTWLEGALAALHTLPKKRARRLEHKTRAWETDQVLWGLGVRPWEQEVRP